MKSFIMRAITSLSVSLLLATAPRRFNVAHADEISVTQWGSSLYGLPYAVAMHDGLFKKAGVDITGILSSGGGGTTVRNILASKTPYGEVAVSAALAAQRQGLDQARLAVPAHLDVVRLGDGERAGDRLFDLRPGLAIRRGVSQQVRRLDDPLGPAQGKAIELSA